MHFIKDILERLNADSVIGIVFIAIFGIILLLAVKTILVWIGSFFVPSKTVRAKIISKRLRVHGGYSTQNYNHASSSYYVTFETENGDRKEMLVQGRTYGVLAEGDRGRLTYRGVRFLKFQRG